MQTRSSCALAIALVLGAILAAPFSATAQTSLTATLSGNDIVLTFPTAAMQYYPVQTTPDLLQPWTTDFQLGVEGNGAMQVLRVTNAILAGKGFYRISTEPTPLRLLLPQSNAFAIIGHSCGGIQEKVYATGFDPGSGYPTGVVYLSTSCSSGGRGSHPVLYSAWAAVTWDFAGNTVSSAVTSAPSVNPTFTATDSYNDVVYNNSNAAYLIVPVSAVPINVMAAQSGDQLQVSWTPNGINPIAITSSTLTATPVNSTAAVVTTTVTGNATNAFIGPVQPQTTYQVTVANTTIGGSSLASTAVSVTTVAATIPPAAPTISSVQWTVADPPGNTDTLVATWNAPDPGNSPIDQYEVTISGSDGAGTFTQDPAGTTLTASFTVDYTPNWSVTVRAHNAAGWSPWSAAITLGGL